MDADDIYNVNETALLFKCLPDKTFTFKTKNAMEKNKARNALHFSSV